VFEIFGERRLEQHLGPACPGNGMSTSGSNDGHESCREIWPHFKLLATTAFDAGGVGLIDEERIWVPKTVCFRDGPIV